MLKRQVSIITLTAFLISLFAAWPVASASDTVYVKEDFNNYITEDMPHGSIESRQIGDSAVRICEEPSESDKSVFVRCGNGDNTAFVQHSFIAAKTKSIKIVFSILVNSSSHFIGIPTIIGSDKKSQALLTLKNGDVVVGGVVSGEFEVGEWTNFDIDVNIESSTFNVCINNDIKNSISSNLTDIKDIEKIRFEAPAGQSFYIDNTVISDGDGYSSAFAASSINEFCETSPVLLNTENQAIVDDILRGCVALYAGSPYLSVNGTKMMYRLNDPSFTPVVAENDILVPLRCFAQLYSYDVLWEEEEQTACITKDGKATKYKISSNIVESNGIATVYESAAAIVNGSTYVSLKSLANVFGKKLYLDDNFAVLGGSDNPFELNERQRLKEDIINSIKYMRPDANTILSGLRAEHPRVLATKDDFATIRNQVAADEFANKMYNYVKTTADAYLNTTPAEYSLKEVYRLGDCVTLVPERVKTLSFIYQISGEEKYAVRCAEELQAMCSFPDWNQSRHYLDTGGMLMAAAIGYDWLYEYLSENDDDLLKLLRERILDYGLLEGIEIHKGTSQYSTNTLVAGWSKSPYNWNPHCNGGIILAALALGDELPEICGPAIELSLRSFEYVCNEFAPDGAWEEGPAYWNVTVEDFVTILAALESACGTDFGYSNAEGILETCYFPVYIMGPNGTFNYSDCATTVNIEMPHHFYWSNKLSDANLSYLRKEQIKKNNYRCKYNDLLWYRQENVASEKADYSFDKYFRKVETVTMRSSWDEDALFLGLHSGNNGFGSHAHLDTGSFVLDQNNIRWFEDLGTDRISYTSASAFTAYRKRAEGHNTLVMQSPDIAETKQDADGNLELVNLNFDDLAEGEAPSGIEVREQGTGAVYVTSNHAGNMNLVLSCDDSEKTTQAFVQKSISNNPIQNRMIIKYKINRGDLNGDIGIPSLRSSENTVALVTFTKGGSVRVYNGQASQNITKYNVGEWYSVEIDVDLITQTYDVVIKNESGEIIGEANDYALRYELKSITLFRIQLYAQNAFMLIDDLEIWVDGANELVTQRKELNDQNERAYCLIDKYESLPGGSFAITDITDAYTQWASSAVRGAGLFDNRRVAVIRDEITMKEETDLYWFAHTQAEIQIADDGRSAILTKGGKKLWVGLIGDSDGVFTVMDAAPFATSPDPDGQTVNSTYRKLTIFIEDAASANITVAFTALSGDETEPASLPAIGSLSTWKVTNKEIPKPESITADGELIDEFNPNRASYKLYIDEGSAVPVIDAKANGCSVSVEQASSIGDCAVITITDSSGNSANYYVNIYKRVVSISTIDGYSISSDSVTASSTPEEVNPPEATLDGDFSTAWASNGMAEWIMYDLGEEKAIDQIQLAWRKGDSRKYSFHIQLSDDGASWTTVYEGASSGTTLELETYKFTETKGRFVRIVCYGNSENTWNNITEIR